jgi:tetratricopeptide (TPR) repeat protein
MKIYLIIISTLMCIQVGYAQQLDNKTLSKIKVKILTANNHYDKKDYSDALTSIEEAEKLAKGSNSSIIQNLKVKVYIGLERYTDAKITLEKLYNMNPPDNILNEIALYESKIDVGIQKAAEKKERDRLAEIKRKKDEELAKIKRKEEERLTEIRRKKELKQKYKEYFAKYVNGDFSDAAYPVLFTNWPKSKIQYVPICDVKRIVSVGVTNIRSSRVVTKFNGEFVDKEGNVVLKVEGYKYAGPFIEGAAAVMRGKEKSQYTHETRTYKLKSGFIDTQGNELFDFIYRGDGGIKSFSEGLSRVRDKRTSKFGFINKKGEMVIPYKYDYAYSFSEGLAAVQNKDSKYGFINPKGEVIIPFVYDEYRLVGGSRMSFLNGKVLVKKRRKFFYINKKGEKIE